MNIVILTLLALPFSYLPVLSFGNIAGLHAHISLIYLLVVASIIVSVPHIIHRWDSIWRLWPMKLLIAFNAYQTFSILWTPNHIRGLYTASFMWLLIAFICTVIAWYPSIASREFTKTWRKGLIVIASVVGIWALAQIFLDAFGFTDLSLLPGNYQSGVFGVARPTGFALEPQFFASILLIPFCWSLVQTINTRRKLFALCLSASFALLLLTLSRGALFGACIGLALVFMTMVRQWQQAGLVIAGLCSGIAVAFLIIFVAGHINTRDNISGTDTLRRSVNQLSLGVIELPDSEPPRSPAPHPSTSSPSSSGYVAASTDSRLSMTSEALELWRSSPRTLLFGVGTGGFGAALHAKDPSFPVGSVVNNYYIEMLAELGIIGLGLFLCFLAFLFVQIVKRRHWPYVALLGALLTQMCFFSGNANIIHIWAIIGLTVAILVNRKHIAANF